MPHLLPRPRVTLMQKGNTRQIIAYTPAVETALIVMCLVCGVGMFAAFAFLAWRTKRSQAVYWQDSRLPFTPRGRCVGGAVV